MERMSVGVNWKDSILDKYSDGAMLVLVKDQNNP